MRYRTLQLAGGPHVVADAPDGPRLTAGGANRTLSDLLALPAADRDAALAPGGPAPAGAGELAPLRPSAIVCIGLNYADHVRESGMETPKRPLIFAKLPQSVIGAGEAVVIDPEVTQQVDWEVELAVVIGETARNVPAERALEHVFGYTVGNDVSARDLQFADVQWVRAKSLDTFCPLGPAVVTRDEVPDPQALALRTRVNGELVQDSSTSEMIFGVAELIAFCSRSFTLRPGDVLLTGTPWGCGAFMDPPRFLAPGDTVETEVDGVGTLVNPVRSAVAVSA
jgi:2-keto-4-pentenoate hydratase/2-oxohepta-3-ene-1,7-dioic acid hydratase in catechol pathway